MHRGLSWIDTDGTIEENPVDRFKRWWFQLHLPGEAANTTFVSPMIAITRASKPMRSEFARVTAGFDVRGFRLDARRLNGGGLLNSWSGVRRAEGEPLLSLRRRQPTQLVEGAMAELAMTERRHIGRLLKTPALIAVEQKSRFGATPNSRFADYYDPDTVPFNSAPFSDLPFSVPSIVAQMEH